MSNDSTMTIEKIMAAMASIPPSPEQFDPFHIKPMSLFGMDVHVAPNVPRFKLSEHVQVTDEFRDKFDAWLVSFFGTTNAVPKDSVLFISGYGILARPEHAVLFRHCI